MDTTIVTPSKKATAAPQAQPARTSARRNPQIAAPEAPPIQNPISIELAEKIGADTAREYLQHDDHVIGTFAEWRARSLAAFTLDVQDQPDFMHVLDAWGYGFDDVDEAQESHHVEPVSAFEALDDIAAESEICNGIIEDLVFLAGYDEVITENQRDSLLAAATRFIQDAKAINERLYKAKSAALQTFKDSIGGAA